MSGASRVVGPEGFAAFVEAAVADKCDEVQRAADNDVREAGEFAAEELREKSPEKTGKYKRGWKSDFIESGAGPTSIVYNSTKPSITHLLEMGHGLRGGGWVENIPHIGPAYHRAASELERRMGL